MKSKPLSGLKQFYFLALYASDVVMFLLAAFLSCLVMRADFFSGLYLRFFLFALLIILVNHSAYGLYRDKRNLFDDNDLMQLFYSVLVGLFILVIFVLIFDPADGILLSTTVLLMVFTFILSIAGRVLLDRIVFFFRKAGYDRKRVLFFGDDNDDLMQKVRENNSLGYEIVKTTKDMGVLKKYLGAVNIVFLHMEKIDEALLEIMIKNDKVQWKIIPPVLNLVIDPVRFDEFRDYPIINLSDSHKASKYAMMKRLFDIIISGLSLLVLSPLFLVVASVIKYTSKGPVFFKQRRLGKSLKPFMLYKFRTMVAGADEMKNKLKSKNEVKGLFKMKDDPRITRFGKFLRRTNFDELPQLINIFRGEMSVVGPRPHLQSELINFKGWRMARFKVKPGLTGLWQVNGRHELNFDKAVLYDIYYIKHMSFFLDLSIIFKTIPSIILSKGRH
jgi:exopolysaccharide biosynthesis polyprenyl glycosylphosphotransferase